MTEARTPYKTNGGTQSPLDTARIVTGLSNDELREMAQHALDFAIRTNIYNDAPSIATVDVMWNAEENLLRFCHDILDRVAIEEIVNGVNDDADDPDY